MIFDNPVLFDQAGQELMPHLAHKITITPYGGDAAPDEIAVECEDCHAVLIDFLPESSAPERQTQLLRLGCDGRGQSLAKKPKPASVHDLQEVVFTLQYCLETFEQTCQCGLCDPCTKGQQDIQRSIRIVEDLKALKEVEPCTLVERPS
jgi:hypothetical protein